MRVTCTELSERTLASVERQRIDEVQLHGYNDETVPLYLCKKNLSIYVEWRGSIYEFSFLGGDPVYINGDTDYGFVTDHGSVPRVVPPAVADANGSLLQVLAYYCHDAGYALNKWTRKECDELLRDMLKLAKLSWWSRNKIYWAVRIGGGSRFPKSKQVREGMLKYCNVREIEKFPSCRLSW